MNSSRFSSFLFIMGMLMCLPELLMEVTAISTLAFLRGRSVKEEDSNRHRHRHPGTFSAPISAIQRADAVRDYISRVQSPYTYNPTAAKQPRIAPAHAKPNWRPRNKRRNPVKPPAPTSKAGSRMTSHRRNQKNKSKFSMAQLRGTDSRTTETVTTVTTVDTDTTKSNSPTTQPAISYGQWGVDDSVTDTHEDYNFDGFTSENTCDLCQISTLAVKNLGCYAAQMMATDYCLMFDISDYICSVPIIECMPVCIFAMVMIIDGNCEPMTNNIYSSELNICQAMGFCGNADDQTDDNILDSMTAFSGVSDDKQPPIDPTWFGNVSSDAEFTDALWWKHGFFSDSTASESLL